MCQSPSCFAAVTMALIPRFRIKITSDCDGPFHINLQEPPTPVNAQDKFSLYKRSTETSGCTVHSLFSLLLCDDGVLLYPPIGRSQLAIYYVMHSSFRTSVSPCVGWCADIFQSQYFDNGFRRRLCTNYPVTANGLQLIELWHNRQRHVTVRGKAVMQISLRPLIWRNATYTDFFPMGPL